MDDFFPFPTFLFYVLRTAMRGPAGLGGKDPTP